jgi:hypothetical protein
MRRVPTSLPTVATKKRRLPGAAGSCRIVVEGPPISVMRVGPATVIWAAVL